RRAPIGKLGDSRLVDVYADKWDRRGQDVAGRDRVQHGGDHDGEPDAGQLCAHGALSLYDVCVDLWQWAVITDRAHQHEPLAALDHRVHDAAGQHAVLDRRGDRAGSADLVYRPDVVFVPVLDAATAGQIDAERGAEQCRLDVVRGQRVPCEEHIDEPGLD